MRRRIIKAQSAPNAAASPSPARPKLPAWLLAVLLALATMVLYWPALQHGFVNYDDDRYVTANPQVQQGLTLAAIRWACWNPVADNWHPLTVWSHLLVCQFSGLNPWGHHLANVLLHATNAVLVFVWLRRLTGAVWKSLAVAALFAWHPLRVESVAWVSERKDVLSGMFGLLALLAYTRYAQAQGGGGGAEEDGGWRMEQGKSRVPLDQLTGLEPRDRSAGHRPDQLASNRIHRAEAVLGAPVHGKHPGRDYWLACFWFALGLLSKPMLVTWPFVLLLLDYWTLGRFPLSAFRSPLSALRSPILRRLVIEKIPFFALAAAAGVVTFIVQKRGADMETIENLSPVAQLENALIAYCRYLGKMFWPVDLSVLYPHPGHWPVAMVLLAGGFLLAVSWMLVVQRRRHPYLLVGWLWFLGTLIPVIGLVQVGLQSMADRYTYLPSLGILILAVWGTEAWTRKWQSQAVPLAVALAAIIACMILTWTQLQYWQDGESLFRHAVAVTENNYVAHYNLGVALDAKGRGSEAIGEYQATLRIRPHYTRAEINLGLDLDQAGQTNEAMQEYQAAIRAAPNNADAHNNLGIAFLKRGQNDEALREFQAAERLAPDNAAIRNSLAAALYQQGRPDEAIHQFQEALRLQSDYAEAHFNLACVLENRGQTDDAIRHLRDAIRLKPDYTEARDRLAKLAETPGK